MCLLGASQVALVVKNPPAIAVDTGDDVQSLDWEDPLEQEMATHSSILAHPQQVLQLVLVLHLVGYS